MTAATRKNFFKPPGIDLAVHCGRRAIHGVITRIDVVRLPRVLLRRARLRRTLSRPATAGAAAATAGFCTAGFGATVFMICSGRDCCKSRSRGDGRTFASFIASVSACDASPA